MPEEPPEEAVEGEPEIPTTTPDERFATNLRQHRERRGLSQAELARLMSEAGYPMHQQTIAKIESGSRPVRLAEAVQLARALDTTIDMLILSPRDTRHAYAIRHLGRENSAAFRNVIKSIHELWMIRGRLERELDSAQRALYLHPELDGDVIQRSWDFGRGQLQRTALDHAIEQAALSFEGKSSRPRPGSLAQTEIEGIKRSQWEALQRATEMIKRYQGSSESSTEPEAHLHRPSDSSGHDSSEATSSADKRE
ncbi:helix-turn-helix transcriptional regulator [Spirillospora sp. NPDC048911]|uniref:helix-turn-helix transcriptional regulator n=1 Tax=Spirillospora sp. NPDC048911 TaxID=3364527 RepID=UPI00371E577A